MSVNWHNVFERVLATTWQAAFAALGASAEAVASGTVDWRTALTGVVLAVLTALSKSVAVELATPNGPSAPDVPPNVPLGVPSDDVRAALTRTPNA